MYLVQVVINPDKILLILIILKKIEEFLRSKCIEAGVMNPRIMVLYYSMFGNTFTMAKELLL
ncbi:MAG TPA: hypothetical protein PLJ44_11520 [Victivallales bacterium]|nr:hypothetical protein [Victivallales bacterium]